MFPANTNKHLDDQRCVVDVIVMFVLKHVMSVRRSHVYVCTWLLCRLGQGKIFVCVDSEWYQLLLGFGHLSQYLLHSGEKSPVTPTLNIPETSN